MSLKYIRASSRYLNSKIDTTSGDEILELRVPQVYPNLCRQQSWYILRNKRHLISCDLLPLTLTYDTPCPCYSAWDILPSEVKIRGARVRSLLGTVSILSRTEFRWLFGVLSLRAYNLCYMYLRVHRNDQHFQIVPTNKLPEVWANTRVNSHFLLT